ncbi:hypothetical protein CKM354_000404100 [Cercospora kikuchii]|uniref:H/ACA ribonucleoprotein complex subunit 2 n=1 Tax=Cercospora kikuchii TaxID=84275 RepID=A0A9P3FB51_9PEZI|nr:snoRNA-binding protein NHP2 [Cercospora kikuchii]GIZ40713.1 hypothetical protein CKM354_000404100 [Cercospora kikuchii]
MGKDKTEAEIAAKKEKKEKKRKHEEVDADAAPTPKKEKKSKKSRKSEGADESVMDIDNTEVSVVAPKEEQSDDKALAVVGIAALVPFANPLASEKDQKKVLKSVKKAAKSKALKRGVKECVKSIRKSPVATPTSLNPANLPSGIVILAADISPMDVISHIPVLCEDHGIPYIYVPSRAELGAAGSTKRPTSVVMLTPNTGKGATESADEWKEAYADLNKLARKLAADVKV